MQKKEDVDKLEGNEKSKIQLETQGALKNYSVIVAAIIVILAGIHTTRAILGPIFLAIFFTILLISPIKWLRSKGIAPWLSLTSVIVAVIAGCVLVATLAATQLAQFAENIPEYRDRFNATLSNYNIGVKIDEFLPIFLKSDNKSEEQAPKEKTDQASARSSNVRANVLATIPRKIVSEGSISEPFVASTEPKVAESASILDSNDVRTGEDSLVPQNPHNSESLSMSDHSIRQDNQVEKNVEGSELAQNPKDDETITEEPTEIEQKNSSVSVNAVAAVDASSEELFSFLSTLAANLSYLGSNAFIVALTIIFMLCEATNIPKKLIAVWGEKEFRSSNIEAVLDDIRRYMVIKTFLSVLVATTATVVLIVSKVQYPFLWGFVVFLLEFIPNLGSVVSAIPPVILATIDHGLVVGGIDALCFAGINCFFGYVLEPKLLGDGLNLSPLVVLISLIFFGWLLGPVGMFLSPPLAVIVKTFFQSFPETLWLASLMSDNPPTRTVEIVQASV